MATVKGDGLLSLKTSKGVARMKLARKDRAVNLLDQVCFEAMEAALASLEKEPPELLVIESGMPGCFIAGADVDVIAGVSDAAEATRLAERGQALMRRIEDLPCPSVAVVAGACMGGGLELALACDFILAVHGEKTKLALPEIRIGIHPGFGGCVRLPRKVGWVAATDMILTGRSVDAKRAARMKLADLACHAEQVEEGICHLAARGRSDAVGMKPWRMRPWWMNIWPARAAFFALVRSKAMQKLKHLDVESAYPAVPAAIGVLKRIAAQSGAHAEGQAYAIEAESLGRLALTPTCKNLVRVFHLGQALQKQEAVKKGRERAAMVDRSAVYGAGVMGSGIAWVAAKSGAVDMHDVSDAALSRGMQALGRLSSRDTERLNRIRPVQDSSGLASCDMVIEAVLEEIEVKNALFKSVAAQVDKDALLLTNTSSLSVSTMQKAVTYPGRMAGMHFFNPAPKMPLVEVVKGAKTTQKTVQTVAALAASWGKYPVIVADTPGFLVNRCLMPYMAAAFALLKPETGDAQTVVHVDGALKQYGMPMGAFELADRVGLDICRHVAEHLGQALGSKSGARQSLPAWFAGMVDAGLLGEKSGRGFFTWEKGRRGELNPELTRYTGSVAPAGHEGDASLADAGSPMASNDVVDACLLPMLAEALACLDEKVVADAEQLDAAMIFGIGFPPFRGGLLHAYAGYGRERLVERFARFGLPAPANLDILFDSQP